MAPESNENKVGERSYLGSAVDSINSWAANRSTRPAPKENEETPLSTTVSKNSGDHSTNPFYGLSIRLYPPDCPPLAVQWFYAVDVPKRKPHCLPNNKPLPRPKKYLAFSLQDSRSIETAYQHKLEEIKEQKPGSDNARAASKSPRDISEDGATNTSLDAKESDRHTWIPVNEDFLFDVDIEGRELAPVYWLGPIYDVRRGSWFYQDGSTLRACDENLAAQLEEGYLKTKPWLYPPRQRSNSGTQKNGPEPTNEAAKQGAKAAERDFDVKPGSAASSPHQPQTYRLFGHYMNHVATYHDESTAYLTENSYLSWVTSTVYERFVGGGYLTGVKLVRGYSEPKKAREEQRASTPVGTKFNPVEMEVKEKPKRQSAPPPSRFESRDESSEARESMDLPNKTLGLTRRLSNLITSGDDDPEAEEEAIRKREEQEMEDDYHANVGESQGREIEHLVLVTHGVGQLLGLRIDSFNFVHDVNILRKTLKSVYSNSADLRALNADTSSGPGNCRVQVLPVLWRHLLDFPKSKKNKGEETDLGVGGILDEENEYPSLEAISINGGAWTRSLISDLALDVLLYQSAYREQICDIVLQESNRIYRLFKDRNPDFKGKVHLIGHSLGSAILFDILCREKEKAARWESSRNPLRFWPSTDRFEAKEPKDVCFDFDVEDFYCLGSPVGLFQMLKGRTIAARQLRDSMPSGPALNLDVMDEPFMNTTSPSTNPDMSKPISPITNLPFSVSSPKAQVFNIAHPADPIAYRLEPLISPAMESLKPQTLPYTKRGIFGAVGPQGLSGFGAKVGQSFSGLLNSLSAGISNSLLNRSLGLTNEDMASYTASISTPSSQSPGAGTNITAGGVISSDSNTHCVEKTAERQRRLAVEAGGQTVSGNEATLIDDELETLFSRFQKKRVIIAREGGKGSATDAEYWLQEEKKAQKLKREESKVKALNRNGRVDYTIQESMLDINPLNAIASHLAYWTDEDVSHFIISQMLSNKTRKPPRAK